MTSKTKFSISQAHRIADKSRTTIAAHLKSGKLAYELDGQGNKLIDATELIRVYGDDCDFERASPSTKPTRKGGQASSSEVRTVVDQQLHTAEQQLATEQDERRREREHLQARIDHLEAALQRAQEGHNRATLLLESRGDASGDWQRTLDALAERVSEQETRFQAELDASTRRLRQYRQALKMERSRPWWKRVFGIRRA